MSQRYERVVVACLAVIPGPDGTVTFIRQRNGPFAGNWLLPGGGVEVGETARAAAAREASEETGCRLDNLAPFAVYEIIGSWPDASPFHVNMTCFLASGEHAVDDTFSGHNVDGILQARPEEVAMHCTDYRILKDAGLITVSDTEIEDRLHADKLIMNTLAKEPVRRA